MMNKPLLDIMKNDTHSLLVGMLLVIRKHLTKSSTSLLVCVQECH
jgi:hypothetical protein